MTAKEDLPETVGKMFGLANIAIEIIKTAAITAAKLYLVVHFLIIYDPVVLGSVWIKTYIF